MSNPSETLIALIGGDNEALNDICRIRGVSEADAITMSIRLMADITKLAEQKGSLLEGLTLDLKDGRSFRALNSALGFK